MRIRRLEPHEAALHRDVRLRALRDAPNAFGETAAQAQAQPPAFWEDLTRSVTEQGRNVMFLAIEGDAVCGATYGLRDRDDDQAGRVGGTWVAPVSRRQAVGSALLEAVFSWARAQGFRRLRLWAPAASPAALALYRRAGFTETGRRGPLPSNADLQIMELERTLPAMPDQDS
ncbi:MAG TPA: GNAT family N-acetyltransferase [Burkholderiales bacterium]|nr:GNAT family N-acetyltransferase [Burkholderiales bacterium]